MSTDLDPQTAGAVIPEPQPVAIITLLQLRAMILEYITDSRTGDTMSYRETAMLPADEAAVSSANHLWAKFEKHGLLAEQQESVADAIVAVVDKAIDDNFALMKFVAGEDLAAGQVCMLSDDNTIVAKPAQSPPEYDEGPAEGYPLPADDIAAVKDTNSEFF